MCVQYVPVCIFNMKTSCLCSIPVCHIIQIMRESNLLQNFTTHWSCQTSGYNLTTLNVTERQENICCIGRIVSYVREMKKKIEKILENISNLDFVIVTPE